MSDASPPATALYQRIVLEHSRAPRRFGALDGATHSADAANPLCGDHLHVDLRVEHGRVVEMAFRGESCAITKATASLLGEHGMGLDAPALAELEAAFARVIRGEVASDAALGDLNALAALACYPARRTCALLAFAAWRAALAGTPSITTEHEPPQ